MSKVNDLDSRFLSKSDLDMDAVGFGHKWLYLLPFISSQLNYFVPFLWLSNPSSQIQLPAQIHRAPNYSRWKQIKYLIWYPFQNFDRWERERESVCVCVFSSSPTKIWARRRARMAAEEEKSPNNPQNPPRRSPRARMKESILSPGFRSAAAMAGWDEEALLFASLVVEDTPVRESRHRKRRSPQFKTPPTTNSNR